MDTPEIFVSYAWKGESEALVDQLCQAFAAQGYAIVRDKSAMTYKDSIKTFMERIGKGKFIIAVVSDKYMRSEYCMYEAYRMFQSPAFRERVFPIVLPDTDIFSFKGQTAYLNYWNTEFKALEAEYRSIANSAPTMVAPLTERLRDIETTTRFINDFMAAVGDMNVLTSQMHIESNFSQLISAIEARMETLEQRSTQVATKENEAKMSDDRRIDTGGGDFVGRDKNSNNVRADIKIGGSVNDSNIVVGNNNVVSNQNTTTNKNLFDPVYHAIEHSNRSTQEREDLKAEVKEIETAVTKDDQVDESWLGRKLRALIRMAPDIGEVAMACLGGPGAAVSAIVKKVVEKVKSEG